MRKAPIFIETFHYLYDNQNIKTMQTYKNLSLEDLPNEQWRQIENYPSYFISNLGRIKSLPKKVVLFNGGIYFTPERIIRQRKSGGYLFVALFNGDNENRFDIQVHIIMACTWLGDRRGKLQVDHINGDKLDNSISNLEWVTHAENMKRAGLNNQMASGKRHHHYGKRGFETQRYRKVINKITGEIFCVKEAAESIGINAGNFSQMLQGKRNNKTDFKYYESQDIV